MKAQSIDSKVAKVASAAVDVGATLACILLGPTSGVAEALEGKNYEPFTHSTRYDWESRALAMMRIGILYVTHRPAYYSTRTMRKAVKFIKNG